MARRRYRKVTSGSGKSHQGRRITMAQQQVSSSKQQARRSSSKQQQAAGKKKQHQAAASSSKQQQAAASSSKQQQAAGKQQASSRQAAGKQLESWRQKKCYVSINLLRKLQKTYSGTCCTAAMLGAHCFPIAHSIYLNWQRSGDAMLSTYGRRT